MRIHIVQKGDTLWTIAQKYNVDFEQLKSLNSQLSDPNMLMPGMKIKVPTGGPTKGPAKKQKEAPHKEMPKKEMPMKEHPQPSVPFPPVMPELPKYPVGETPYEPIQPPQIDKPVMPPPAPMPPMPPKQPCGCAPVMPAPCYPYPMPCQPLPWSGQYGYGGRPPMHPTYPMPYGEGEKGQGQGSPSIGSHPTKTPSQQWEYGDKGQQMPMQPSPGQWTQDYGWQGQHHEPMAPPYGHFGDQPMLQPGPAWQPYPQWGAPPQPPFPMPYGAPMMPMPGYQAPAFNEAMGLPPREYANEEED